MQCVFCAISKGGAPASVIYEDALSIVFLDINPINKGHALVIPKEHWITLEDCPEGTVRHLAAVLKRVNGMVAKAVRCEGVLNEVMNGEAAGQEVFHLHWHVIPRFAGDGFGWFYPEGYLSAPADRDELNEIAGRIRAAAPTPR